MSAIEFIYAFAWLGPVILASYWMFRYSRLADTAKAIWALIILVVPFIGPLAFIIYTEATKRFSP